MRNVWLWWGAESRFSGRSVYSASPCTVGTHGLLHTFAEDWVTLGIQRMGRGREGASSHMTGQMTELGAWLIISGSPPVTSDTSLSEKRKWHPGLWWRSGVSSGCCYFGVELEFRWS